MATREHQGLQIALILCVFLIVGLGAFTYYFFNKSETKTRELLAANQQVSTAQRSLGQALDKVQFLEHLVGFKHLDESSLESLMGNLVADPEVKTMYDNFVRDLQTYGAGLPEQQQKELDYSTMPEKLVTANLKLSERVQERDQEVLRLQTEHAAELAKLRTDLAEMQKARDGYQADLESERAAFNTKMQQVEKDRDAIKADLDKKNDEIKTVVDQSTQEKAQLTTQLDRLQKLYVVLRDKAKTDQPDQSFEVADGRVSWVNQRTNTVWLNLGSADGLRRQVTFSVYDQDEASVTGGEPKASIEVTRIIEPHLAEAKILEDNITNPILPGDKVFSPAWRPGRRVHFALAGFMDVDDDGVDDRQYLKNLIHANGGVIDAELLDDGEVKGTVSVNTRYFVKGERPTEKTGPNVQAGYSKMVDDASAFGIEQISVDKLLSYMGAKGTEKTITLGSGNADDYRLRARQGAAAEATNGNEQFRPRQPGPPPRGQNGAF